jgi:pimeloyl-ACP methyl ester carboxylesterase
MPEILMEPPEALRPFASTVRVGDLSLHCYIAGPEGAPALLLVHGLGDEADTWRRVLPALAERYRVVAPDLPGFGRSSAPRRAGSAAFYARTLAGLMGALGLARVTAVGHSGGAMIAQRLALGAPQLVERLALVSGCLPVATAGLPGGAIYAFLTPGLGELIYTSLRRSQDEAYATLRPYYADLDGLPEEEREFLRRRVWARVWSERQRAAFLSMLRWSAIDAATRSGRYREQLARCRTPTRLIWGEQDQIIPRALGDAMAALVPGASMHTIPACGHLPQQERPEALLALIGG